LALVTIAGERVFLLVLVVLLAVFLAAGLEAAVFVVTSFLAAGFLLPFSVLLLVAIISP
jgi:hypothetical protein